MLARAHFKRQRFDRSHYIAIVLRTTRGSSGENRRMPVLTEDSLPLQDNMHTTMSPHVGILDISAASINLPQVRLTCLSCSSGHFLIVIRFSHSFNQSSQHAIS